MSLCCSTNLRIRKAVRIITDLDAAFFDTKPDPLDATRRWRKQREGARRAAPPVFPERRISNEFCKGNPWVSSPFAPHTFEVDFVAAGNSCQGRGRVE